eukprot:SAG22_NODE_566_length_9044_cov_4.581107_5_plen_142_part_00
MDLVLQARTCKHLDLRGVAGSGLHVQTAGRDDLTVMRLPTEHGLNLFPRIGTNSPLELRHGVLNFIAHVDSSPNKKLCVFGEVTARRKCELQVLSIIESAVKGSRVRGNRILFDERCASDIQHDQVVEGWDIEQIRLLTGE